jgi:dipeptidyl aminopeptidase/acylaminoacyl peptidase
MVQFAIEVSHEGMTIRGMAYLPAGDGRHPTVLMLHGLTGSHVESGFMFVTLARRLNRLGVAAVAFDFRHSGDSDGSFDRMLVTGELADALRMTDWLHEQPYVDADRLALLGLSLGGLLVPCVQARRPAFKALVMIAPTTVANVCRYAAESRGGRKQTIIGPHVLHPDIFRDVRTLDPLADITRHPQPTLIVQGTGDNAVPPEVSDQYVQALRHIDAPAEYAAIDGADHGFSHPVWRERLFEAVVPWLRGRLMP